MAWYAYQTKSRVGANWVGTSFGMAEDMLKEILADIKFRSFTIDQIVIDHD